MPEPPTLPVSRCPNCGETAMLNYCSNCGEQRVDQERLRFGAYAGEAFEDITNVEHSKLWRTLHALVLKPGKLTQEFLGGRRKRYIGPLKLYLVFFALLMIAYTIHQPSAMFDLRTIIASDPYGNWQRILSEMTRELNISQNRFVAEVNPRWQSYLSFSQLIYPVFVALMLRLLYIRHRIYYAEHLVFSLHVLAFVSLGTILVWPVYFFSGIQFNTVYFISAAATLLITFGYLLLAQRRFYGQGWSITAVKALLAYTGYFILTMIVTFGSLMLAMIIVARAAKRGLL